MPIKNKQGFLFDLAKNHFQDVTMIRSKIANKSHVYMKNNLILDSQMAQTTTFHIMDYILLPIEFQKMLVFCFTSKSHEIFKNLHALATTRN